MDFETKNKNILEDELNLHSFVYDLVSNIGMKIVPGSLHQKYYRGRDIVTEVWSIIAMLDTSSISIHTSPILEKVFLDIFSCKEIDPLKVRSFLADYDVYKINYTLLKR
jgi:S-adenosylmethionine/arginine decarboxylase-like enzyme